MITISYEQGLITVDNWEAVTQLPGYVAKLDHETNPLEAIRGRYQMKPEVNCGLKSCNQPHEKGYVVTTGYTHENRQSSALFANTLPHANPTLSRIQTRHYIDD